MQIVYCKSKRLKNGAFHKSVKNVKDLAFRGNFRRFEKQLYNDSIYFKSIKFIFLM